MQRLILILTALLLAGCATVPVDPTTPLPGPSVGAHGQVRAVWVGLTMTSPYADNLCAGADVDALSLARAAGLSGVTLLNSQATWAQILAAAHAEAAHLTRADMLVLDLSGHGDQTPDDNGDEADGLDEVLCLFAAGPDETIDLVRDDRVMTELLQPLWAQVPGLDILLITDTCHAEGNFRALWRRARAQPAPPPLVVTGTARGPVDGGLVQIAMCREAGYSMGSMAGGTGTQALLAVIRAGQGRLATFHALRAALALAGAEQVPVWTEYGTVSELLRNGGGFWQ